METPNLPVRQRTESGSAPGAIPYAELETIFFDVGNTLISIDFDWVTAELAPRGIACSPAELRRAEARARPALSDGLAEIEEKETQDTFAFYLSLVLLQLEGGRALGETHVRALAAELTPVLRGPGKTQRLWSCVLAGVPEALTRMAEIGLQLAVVSNSDGSVESGLVDQGLRDRFEVVIDSKVVGYEKPDPRIFEEALARCGADAARTLHVGDLYAADVVGARAANIHALLLDPYDDWIGVDCVKLPNLTRLAEAILSARADDPATGREG